MPDDESGFGSVGAQENYDFKQYTIDPADAQRRGALLTIQSFLPFAGRR